MSYSICFWSSNLQVQFSKHFEIFWNANEMNMHISYFVHLFFWLIISILCCFCKTFWFFCLCWKPQFLFQFQRYDENFQLQCRKINLINEFLIVFYLSFLRDLWWHMSNIFLQSLDKIPRFDCFIDPSDFIHPELIKIAIVLIILHFLSI